MLKRFAALFLLVLMSIESFAAIVGDSDGPSFITKAEFEALKANFNQQIDNYNDSLSNKIDGSIANYLEGLKVANKVKAKTGFDLAGKERKEIRFLGRNNNSWNFSNDLYARDKIVLYANGAFSTATSHYVHDTYDNWLWDGQYSRGNTTNTYFLLDKDNCVDHIYWNVAMYVNRFYAFYSTTNAQDGITWNEIKMQLNHPSFLISTDDAGIDADNSYADGYGHSRINQTSTPGATYPTALEAWMFSSGGVNNQTAVDFTRDASYYVNPDLTQSNSPKIVVVTPLEEKTQASMQKQYSVSMSKNEIDYGIHLCYQPTVTVHSSNQEWASIAMCVKDKDELQDYTVTPRLRFASGYWSNAVRDLSADSRIVKGYGVKFHELLDTTKTDKPPKNTFNDIYYKELNKVWGEAEKLKYTGGFPIFMADKDGDLEFRIKADKTTNIIFTTSQNSSMPTTSATNLRVFNYKLTTAANYSSDVTNFSVTANTYYDFKVELYKDEILYLNIDSETGNVIVNQSGDAYWTAT